MEAKTTHKPSKKSEALAVTFVLMFLFPVFGANAHGGHPVVNEYLTTLLRPLDKVKTVCIDPGHGGHDPGCHGSFVNEKTVALAIGLKLGKLINTYYPDIKVVYTRKTDVFVELHKRAEIANKANADLFICIHCNAGPETAHGAETYVLGLHKSEANLAVAKRENASILLESDYKENYRGLDVNSPEGSIIYSYYQNTFLNRSLSFAAKCQQYFVADGKRYDRAVKQAGFLVLWKTTMPAVLIETGFLSNKAEEKFLMESGNQDVMALAILKAFTDYKNEIEGTSVKLDFTLLEKEKTEKEDVVKKTETTPTTVETPEGILPKKESGTFSSKAPIFKVQFFSAVAQEPNPEVRFKGVDKISYYKSPNGYAYMSGESDSLDEIKKVQEKLRANGYPDAFVVAFTEGNRISVKEALEILKKKH